MQSLPSEVRPRRCLWMWYANSTFPIKICLSISINFPTKFRDEIRARGGLLRVREFIMKDGYSFHTDAEDFKKSIKNMHDTYKRIFDGLSLTTQVVESDNGYIGENTAMEFVVDAKIGESKYLVTTDGNYAAHEDVALFIPADKNLVEELLPLKEPEAVRGTTMKTELSFIKSPFGNR